MLGIGIINGIASCVHNIVATGAERAVGFLGYDEVLNLANESLKHAHQQTLLALIVAASCIFLAALLGLLGPVESVARYIMHNSINKETFDFIGTRWADVAQFMINLFEPMRRYAPADSKTGDPDAVGEEYNAYNELDLTITMNRHAVVSQIQRLGRSLIALFSQKHVSVGKFVMNTILDTDTASALSPMPALLAKRREGQRPETWLCITGIAGEYCWTAASVQKIREYFFDPVSQGAEGDATVKGIFNRSDGMLWDLIECAGERCPEPNGHGQPSINEMTEGSRIAKNELVQELEIALSPPNDKKDIVLIAHSQGCLLTRLAIDELHQSSPELQKAMEAMLSVFTFGNPAYDWDLHAYVKYTEHYANAADLMAKLGVFRPTETSNGDPYYCRDCAEMTPGHSRQLVFVNQKRKGHLFGSQYSLHAGDYVCKTRQFGKAVLLGRARTTMAAPVADGILNGAPNGGK